MPKFVCALATKPLEWATQRDGEAMVPQGVQETAGCDGLIGKVVISQR